MEIVVYILSAFLFGWLVYSVRKRTLEDEARMAMKDTNNKEEEEKEMSDNGYKFVLTKNTSGSWYFKFVAPNGEIMVISEAYSSKANAMNSIASLQKNVRHAAISVEEK